MKAAAITASDKTLVTVTEETLHPEGAMLSLVLTKPNAKWLGALLSPAEAHQLSLQLYEWAAGQDAAFRPAPAGEHQGRRRVSMADLAVHPNGPAICNHIGCKRRRANGHWHCESHLPREVAR